MVSVNSRWLSKRRGGALVFVVIFGAIVSLMAGVAYRSVLLERRMAERNLDYICAMGVAECGAERAMEELNKTATDTVTPFDGWAGGSTRTWTETVKDVDQRIIGETTVEVSGINSNTPLVVATGYVPNKTGMRVSRRIQLTTRKETVPAPFGTFGIFAFNDINIRGASIIQSFDSSLLQGLLLLGQKANIAAMGDIDIGIPLLGLNVGAAIVKGNLQAGGHIRTPLLWLFSGNKISRTAPTPPPPLPKPDIPQKPPDYDNNSQIDLRDILGGKIDVPSRGAVENDGIHAVTFKAPGNYVLDHMSLNGVGALNIVGRGDVNIYVNNTLAISGAAAMNILNGARVRIVAKEIKFNGLGAFNFFGRTKVDFIADDVSVNGASSLLMPNNHCRVKFLVKNDLKFTGATSQNSLPFARPENLQFFVGGKVIYAGLQAINCCMYAPNSDFELDLATVYAGVLLARNINMLGAAHFYVDEAALRATDGNGTYVTSWLELPPPSPSDK